MKGLSASGAGAALIIGHRANGVMNANVAVSGPLWAAVRSRRGLIVKYNMTIWHIQKVATANCYKMNRKLNLPQYLSYK